jgi:hypothetical protein
MVHVPPAGNEMLPSANHTLVELIGQMAPVRESAPRTAWICLVYWWLISQSSSWPGALLWVQVLLSSFCFLLAQLCAWTLFLVEMRPVDEQQLPNANPVLCPSQALPLGSLTLTLAPGQEHGLGNT